MSLGYPRLQPKEEGTHTVQHQDQGNYGLPDLMRDGLQRGVKSDLASVHPLQYSEQHYRGNQEQMDAMMLRNTQGIHAPLKLQMERDVASKIQRGPGLHSSNLMRDILTGKLDTIDFEDVLNDPANAEQPASPHLLAEKRLGIL